MKFIQIDNYFKKAGKSNSPNIVLTKKDDEISLNLKNLIIFYTNLD